MRVLLDACVPQRISHHLPGHEVRTAQGLGWGDLNDGPLLDAMAGAFDVLLTVDQRLPQQQQARSKAVGIIVLRARTNRLQDLLPLMTAVLSALEEIQVGEVRTVSS